MPVWRQTYSSVPRSTAGEMRILSGTGESPLVATEKTELRDASGQIIRLAQSAEIALIDTPLGPTTEVFGECYLKLHGQDGPMHGRSHKYRTSCWTGVRGLGEIHCRTVKPGLDQISAVQGHLLIWEIDEDNRLFLIADVEEGHSAQMTYDSSKRGRDRYAARLEPIDDTLYDHILKTFLDPSAWR